MISNIGLHNEEVKMVNIMLTDLYLVFGGTPEMSSLTEQADGRRKSFSLFQVPNKTSLYGFACAFWNYTLNDWSTYGCFKENRSNGLLTCHCNHTTNFAALWVNSTSMVQSALILTHLGLNVTHDFIMMILFLFQSFRENYEYVALDRISIIGLSLSILGLVISIIHHTKEK